MSQTPAGNPYSPMANLSDPRERRNQRLSIVQQATIVVLTFVTMTYLFGVPGLAIMPASSSPLQIAIVLLLLPAIPLLFLGAYLGGLLAGPAANPFVFGVLFALVVLPMMLFAALHFGEGRLKTLVGAGGVLGLLNGLAVRYCALLALASV